MFFKQMFSVKNFNTIISGGSSGIGRELAIAFSDAGAKVTITPMNKVTWENPIEKKKRTERTILGRWAEVKDLIGPTMFLTSDASNYVTGIDLPIDGGWTAKGL